MSIAMTLVRESSALMVGQYFKRRRDFVEIVVQMGAGIGVILFSVFFKEALGYYIYAKTLNPLGTRDFRKTLNFQQQLVSTVFFPFFLC